MVHVRVKGFYIGSEKEPVRVYRLILAFLDKVKSILNVGGMFIGKGLKVIVNEGTYFRGFSVNIRNNWAAGRAERMGPRCTWFMYFRKEIKVAGIAMGVWN